MQKDAKGEGREREKVRKRVKKMFEGFESLKEVTLRSKRAKQTTGICMQTEVNAAASM